MKVIVPLVLVVALLILFAFALYLRRWREAALVAVTLAIWIGVLERSVRR